MSDGVSAVLGLLVIIVTAPILVSLIVVGGKRLLEWYGRYMNWIFDLFGL